MIAETRHELRLQPARLQETLDALHNDCKQIAQDLAERNTRQIDAVGCVDSSLVAGAVALHDCPGLFFVGAGPRYATAGFRAATAKDQAVAVPLEEFHHYP